MSVSSETPRLDAKNAEFQPSFPTLPSMSQSKPSLQEEQTRSNLSLPKPLNQGDYEIPGALDYHRLKLDGYDKDTQIREIALGELASYGIGEFDEQNKQDNDDMIPPLVFEWRGKPLLMHRLKQKAKANKQKNKKTRNPDDSDSDEEDSEENSDDQELKPVDSPVKNKGGFGFQRGSPQNRPNGVNNQASIPGTNSPLERTAPNTISPEGTSAAFNAYPDNRSKKKKKYISPEEAEQIARQEIAEATGIQMQFDDFDRDDPDAPFPEPVFEEENSLTESVLDHSMLEDYFFHEVYCWNDVATTEEPTANDNFKSVFRPAYLQPSIPFEVLFAAKQARRIKFTRYYPVGSTANLQPQHQRSFRIPSPEQSQRPMIPAKAVQQPSKPLPPAKVEPKPQKVATRPRPPWMVQFFNILGIYMKRLWHTKIPKEFRRQMMLKKPQPISIDDRTADFHPDRTENSQDEGAEELTIGRTVSFMPKDRDYNQSVDWQSQDEDYKRVLTKKIAGGNLELKQLPKKVPDDRKLSIQPFEHQLDANFEKEAERAGDNVQVVLTFTTFPTEGNEHQRVTRKLAPINPKPGVALEYEKATANLKAEVFVDPRLAILEDALMPPRAFPRFAEIDIPMRELEDPMDRFRRNVNARARQQEMLPTAKEDPWKELSLIERFRSKNPVFERALREYYERSERGEPGSTVREDHELEQRIVQLEAEIRAAQERRRKQTDLTKFLAKEFDEGNLDANRMEGTRQYWEDISKHLENPEMLDLLPPGEEPELIKKLPASTAIRIYKQQELEKAQGKRAVRKDILDLDDESPQQQSLLAMLVDKNVEKSDTHEEKQQPQKKVLRGLAKKMNRRMNEAKTEVVKSKANPIEIVTPLPEPPAEAISPIKKPKKDSKDQTSSSAVIPPKPPGPPEATTNNPLGLPSLNKPSEGKNSALRSRSVDWEVANDLKGLPSDFQFRRNVYVRQNQDANASDYEAEFDEEGKRIDPKFVYKRPDLLHIFHEPTVDVLKKKHAEAPYLEGVTPRPVDFHTIYNTKPETREERKQRNNPARKRQQAVQAMRELLGSTAKDDGNDQLAELLLRKKGNLVKFSEPNKTSGETLPPLNKNGPVSFSLDAGQKSSSNTNQDKKVNQNGPPRTILRNKGQA